MAIPDDPILEGAVFHLVQHLIGNDDSGVIECYEALEKDIHRWADILKRVKTVDTVEKPRLELSSDRLQIRVNSKWYDISEAAKDMLTILMEAEGGWVVGKTIGGRPDKLRKKMPKVVANIIETNNHDGYRIKPKLFQNR